MKTLICLVFLSMVCVAGSGQTFIGSNPGLSSIGQNPSLLSASRNNVEIQIFSASASFGGYQSYFSVKHLNPRAFSNTIFQHKGTVSGYADVNILGPSVMKKFGKNTFSIFTRARLAGSVRNFDGQLAHSLNEQYFRMQAQPFRLASTSDMRGNLNAWTEIGFSYSRALLDNGHHRLYGGTSVRLMAGLAGADFRFGPFEGIGGYNKQLKAYAINEATGNVALNVSGLKISGLNLNSVVMQGSPALGNVKIHRDGRPVPQFSNGGVGVDLGVTYEYRSDDEGEDHNFRLGIALVDVGSTGYRKDTRQSGNYAIDITGLNALKISEVFNLDLVKARKLFEDHPESFKPLSNGSEARFRTNLPTAVNIDVDQRIAKNVFVASSWHIAVGETGWSYASVIPRYESDKFGVAVPVTYDWLSKSRAGLVMRYRFLTLGSSGLFTSITQPTRQMDAMLGVSIRVR